MALHHFELYLILYCSSSSTVCSDSIILRLVREEEMNVMSYHSFYKQSIKRSDKTPRER